MVAVLSNLSREKSGAESPMFKSPARARVHIVSKGTARKISHGICDITRAKSSGVLCIARQMKATKPIQSTNIALRIPAAIFFQRAFFVGTGEMLDGVLMNSPR